MFVVLLGVCQLEKESKPQQEDNTTQDEDGDGYSLDSGDCDDTDANINLGATETCDEIDNDCDGDIDESDAVDVLTWYADSDGDGFGDATTTIGACSQPDGYSLDSGDCDDADSSLNLDDVDGDGFSTCDDDCDDNDSSLTPTIDNDGDGSNICDDCDDTDSNINPGTTDTPLWDRDCFVGVDNSLSNSDYAFIGENEDDYSGYSVSSAGDVDGDGKDDIIGAYGNDDGGGNWSDYDDGAGKSYLILGSSLGSTSTIDLSNADYSFIGENLGDRSGFSVSSAGDVNGDGKHDILIGAHKNADGGNDAGKTYLIFSGL